MIIIEFHISEDFSRAELEKFLDLTKGMELSQLRDDHLDLCGLMAVIDG